MVEDTGITGTRGHKHRRGGNITLAVVLLVLLALAVGLAAYRPSYRYYRSGISRCMEWGNAWKISDDHLNKLLDSMEAVSGGNQPSASVRKVLTRIRRQEGSDRKQALETGIYGTRGCSARQLSMSRHRTADMMRRLTARSEQAIAELHNMDTLLPPQADDLALLKAIMPGLAEFAEDSKTQVGENAPVRLTLVDDLHQVGEHPDPGSVPALVETLYRDADRLVQARNERQGIDCAHQSCLALTFDDGPDQKLTNQALDVLAKSRSIATFFPVGQKVGPQTAPILERMTREGYPVGNHTWSHQDLPDSMAKHQEEQEFIRSGQVIRTASKRTAVMVRPPHGRVDEASRTYIRNHLGAAIAMYDVDSYDWAEGATPDSVHRKIKAELQPGSIILMHDIQSHTLEALPGLLDDLHNEGYRPVTIPELTGEYPRAGTVYYSRTNILRP